MGDLALAAQAVALLWTIFTACLRAAVSLPVAFASIAWRRARGRSAPPAGGIFYAGSVFHSRKRPRENSFTYPVRMAVVDLDFPPQWWTRSPGDNMSATEARRLAGTTGPVRLLTHPSAAGYEQNPISVYYCYSPDGASLERCIAEVTNTPWGERVTFLFRPGLTGEEVPKALHVSPLMDMQSTWVIKATDPGERLFLSVGATHPELGDYFIATLTATVDASAPALPNETASLGTLLRYGFQPHRVALWIYWQAVVLLWKGVPFFGPPHAGATQRAAEAAARPGQPRLPGGRAFVWRPAGGWPWAVAEGS